MKTISKEALARSDQWVDIDVICEKANLTYDVLIKIMTDIGDPMKKRRLVSTKSVITRAALT